MEIHQYYWEIIKWDGEKIKVKPENAEYVQNLIAKGEGFIKTATMTMNVKDIKSFDKTDAIYSGDQKRLEEGAAQAFKEALTFERDSGFGYTETVTEAKWCKKSVTRRKWEQYYSANAAYHKIEEDDNRVIIAFRIPTHLINSQLVAELTEPEISINHL
jgi:hypothetical protein